MQAEIIVFAKAAIAGQVKTRIAATVGHARATEIYIRLLNKAVLNAVAASKQAACSVSIHYDGPRDHPVFNCLANQYPELAFHPQISGNLGARMHAALEQALSSNEVTLIIGADCPALSPEIICDALRSVGRPNQFGFVPAIDGGYVLVASCASNPAVFSDIDWGTSRVMATTAQRLADNNIAWTQLEPLADVDTWEDYNKQKQLL